MKNTLLLTTCIQPSWSTPWKSSDQLFLETRNWQYLHAAKYYIKYSNFNNIVICDNSNYNFNNVDRHVIRSLAVTCNKQLELLSFDGNTKSHIYGYGYGEAEIFDHAYENSILLRQSTSRYKITGRYIIKDINYIIKKLQFHNVFFHKQGLFMTPFTVSTAFFKISNSIYKKNLYKNQTKLFELLYIKSYKEEYFYKDHFPLERVWYCLLYNYLTSTYKNINNIGIIYLFPQTNTYWIFPMFRNIVYQIYVLLWWSQFGLFHRFLHYSLFYKFYKQAISDKFF